jgi:transcriptional regulator with XRE-family HTH domain
MPQTAVANNAAMWKYLRAWRKYRGYSQEQVANTMQKRHTTIGRWERGEMRITTEDLQALAALYGASIAQLQGPPDLARLTARMERAQAVLDNLSDEDLERWLALGESLARR